jgi:hypothetical protein
MVAVSPGRPVQPGLLLVPVGAVEVVVAHSRRAAQAAPPGSVAVPEAAARLEAVAQEQDMGKPLTLVAAGPVVVGTLVVEAEAAAGVPRIGLKGAQVVAARRTPILGPRASSTRRA